MARHYNKKKDTKIYTARHTWHDLLWNWHLNDIVHVWHDILFNYVVPCTVHLSMSCNVCVVRCMSYDVLQNYVVPCYYYCRAMYVLWTWQVCRDNCVGLSYVKKVCRAMYVVICIPRYACIVFNYHTMYVVLCMSCDVCPTLYVIVCMSWCDLIYYLAMHV